MYYILQKKTALDDYVKLPDPTYTWELLEEFPGEGYTAYTLKLTSQTWLTGLYNKICIVKLS